MAYLASDHSMSANRSAQQDPRMGSQNGFIANASEILDLKIYTRQPLIGVLLAAPGFMKYMDDGETRVEMLRIIMESMADTVTGLNATVTGTYEDAPSGKAGEMLQVNTLNQRARSEPIHTFTELEGMFFANFFTEMKNDLERDPDTQHMGLINKAAYIAAGSPVPTLSDITFSMLYFEPNINMTKPVKAWVVYNMMSMTGGDITGENNVGQANAIQQQPIGFTARSFFGGDALTMAQDYLDSLQAEGMDGNAIPHAYDGVTAEVDTDSASMKSIIGQVATNAGA